MAHKVRLLRGFWKISSSLIGSWFDTVRALETNCKRVSPSSTTSYLCDPDKVNCTLFGFSCALVWFALVFLICCRIKGVNTYKLLRIVPEI